MKKRIFGTMHGSFANNYRYSLLGEPICRAQSALLATYKQSGRHIYGSSRLGMETSTVELIATSVLSPYWADASVFTTNADDRVYELTNHLGNVLATFTGRKLPLTEADVVVGFAPHLTSLSDYYPFGSGMEGRTVDPEVYPFGSAGGSEVDNEMYGVGNSYNLGARMFDPRIGRTSSTDPAFKEYPSTSSFVGFGNNPLVFIDPDGKRLYFVGGAGNDALGWDYINRFKSIFTSKGIDGFTRINASGGTNKDIAFTTAYSSFSDVGQHIVKTNEGLEVRIKRRDHKQIAKAVADIKADLAANPLGEGEQLNLAGYSYGSVVQAHVALRLADEGILVDNLVLIGSPISDKSELYNALTTHKNIGKVIREDIPGDKLSNPQNRTDLIEGGLQNADPNNTGEGPHFDYARPGPETNKRIGRLADRLKKEGVK